MIAFTTEIPASTASPSPAPAPAANHRTLLVSVETVCAVRGADRDTIYNQVESGRFMWVWNVATRLHINRVRELRFLTQEVFAQPPAPGFQPHPLRDFKIKDIVRLIVPESREWFRNWEIGQLLGVGRPTLIKLRGELEGDCNSRAVRVRREALVHFFAGPRWVNHPANILLKPKY